MNSLSMYVSHRNLCSQSSMPSLTYLLTLAIFIFALSHKILKLPETDSLGQWVRTSFKMTS